MATDCHVCVVYMICGRCEGWVSLHQDSRRERERDRERVTPARGREIRGDNPRRRWVFSIWLMLRMRVHMWRTAVSDSSSAQLPPSTFDRTHIRNKRERERENERPLLSSSLIFHVGIRACYFDCVALVLQRSRERYAPCPEYTTRSTRVNWHYDYDMVVSLATVTPSIAPSTTSRRLAAYLMAPVSSF